MKRTLVVLALAALCAPGCRAIGPQRGCSDGCVEPCEPSHVTRQRMAPRPDGSYFGYGRGGNLEQDCPGGSGGMFDRYCGHGCGPGYHPGPYDCSPCHSPHWGITGHRHPHGYRDGRGCLCDAQGRPLPHGAYAHGMPPGAGSLPRSGYPYPMPPDPGYCGGGPAGPGQCHSNDHLYNFAPGPPVAQTAYPYYTLRGPRDFLLGNPPPLGPF